MIKQLFIVLTPPPLPFIVILVATIMFDVGEDSILASFFAFILNSAALSLSTFQVYAYAL